MTTGSGKIELIIAFTIVVLICVTIVVCLYKVTTFLLALFALCCIAYRHEKRRVIMRTLLIDDIRTFGTSRTCRTVDEGIQALQEDGPWDLLYLDHDLPEEKSGYTVACWLEQHRQFQPRIVKIVSTNPTGIKNIELILQKDYCKLNGDWHRKE